MPFCSKQSIISDHFLCWVIICTIIMEETYAITYVELVKFPLITETGKQCHLKFAQTCLIKNLVYRKCQMKTKPWCLLNWYFLFLKQLNYCIKTIINSLEENISSLISCHCGTGRRFSLIDLSYWEGGHPGRLKFILLLVV